MSAGLVSTAWPSIASAQVTTGRIDTGVRPTAPEDPLQTWVDTYGRPTADVMVNGRGPYRFLVDTGANKTVLPMRHALDLGAEFHGNVTVHGTTGSAEFSMARLDHLSVGSVERAKIEIAVAPDHLMRREDGILGADIFAGRRLVFEIAAKVVRVQTSRAAPIYARTNLRILNGVIPVLRGRIGRVRTQMILDTGADQCIVNAALKAKLDKAHANLIQDKMAKLQGITGTVLSGDYLLLPDMRMGNVAVADASAVAVDAPVFRVWGVEDEPTIIVGSSVLSRLASFTIDYGARQFEGRPFALLARDEAVRQG
ncbi:MAG: retropepsin-like aspartic protease [Hyphomonadaceae bacterium]